MNLLYITLINIILIFIASVILNNRINKKSTGFVLEEYTREVEKLIVELNRALDDVLNISEERLKELKRVIKKAEKVLNDPQVKIMFSSDSEQKKKKSRLKERINKTSLTEEDIGKGKIKENGIKVKNAEISYSGRMTGTNLLEKTKHLLAMGYSKEEIADILHINRAEVDFLESLNR